MLSNEISRFLSEIENDITTGGHCSNSEIMIFIFTVSKNGLYMNSGLNVLTKGLKCSMLV